MAQFPRDTPCLAATTAEIRSNSKGFIWKTINFALPIKKLIPRNRNPNQLLYVLFMPATLCCLSTHAVD
jgi:hypothetical protein